MNCKHLFDHVRCMAYMKPIKDGCFIDVRDEDGTKHTGPLTGKEALIGVELFDGAVKETDLSFCDGKGVTKTYYQRTKRSFSGVVVGTKKLKHKALLFTDVDFRWDGSEHYFIGKDVKYVDVYIVYYANNKKMYVLPEDIECDVEE